MTRVVNTGATEVKRTRHRDALCLSNPFVIVLARMWFVLPVEHLLDHLSHLVSSKRFDQTRTAHLIEKGRGLRTQDIAGEKDDARAQVRIALLEFAVKSRPIQLGHAYITQNYLVRS